MIDTYKIGIQIALASNANLILGVLGKQIFGLGKEADALAGKFNAAKVAAWGAMSAIAGAAALGVMTKLVEAATEYNQQLAQMKMANYAPTDISLLKGQAEKTVFSVPGSNMTDNLKMGIDLRNISGAAGHAAVLLDNVTRTNLVLANISKKPAGEAGYLFMKFLEDSGRMMDPKTGEFSEKRVEEENKWMQAVIAGMNARVTGGDLFQLRQSGKASVNSLTNDGLTNLLPFIQSLGAVGVGTALQGAQQQLLGAVQLRKQTVDWMAKYGMVDAKKAHLTKGGFFKLDPGGVTGEQTMMHDLAGWVWNVLIPQMAAKGLSKEQMVDEIKRSGLRTPLLGFIAEAIQNQTVQQKEIGNVHRAEQVDQYKVMLEESPTFRITRFQEAWTNLMTSLGSPLVDAATRMLNPLTDALNGLTKWALANPDTVLEIGKVATVLSGLAIAVGVFAIGGAAIAAMSVLGGGAIVVGSLAGVAVGAIALCEGLKLLDAWLRAHLPFLFPSVNDPSMPGSPGFKDKPTVIPPYWPLPGPSGSTRESWGDWWNSFGPPKRERQPDDQEMRMPRMGPPPPPSSVGKQSLLQNNIYLDGRKIAEVVSDYIGRSRPPSMPTAGDPRRGALMPGSAFG